MIWTIFTEVRDKNLKKIVQNAKEEIQYSEILKIVKTFKLLNQSLNVININHFKFAHERCVQRWSFFRSVYYRIRIEYAKIQTRKKPYLDIFHAVEISLSRNKIYRIYGQKRINRGRPICKIKKFKFHNYGSTQAIGLQFSPYFASKL